ncbi:MAG: ATP-dependent DNA helicase UvrD2 [Nanoarchaeota archaeon]|nr:ATP-dependent DNA helicase UvrD2 [Nanoarchaeota archaeon]
MDDLDYILALKALKDIPFGVGKKLLIDFLKGEPNNESIKRNNLSAKESFGSLAYDKDELSSMIDNLLLNNLIQQTSVKGNRFWKVYGLSAKGEKEIESPALYKKRLSYNFRETPTKITLQDKKIFSMFGEFLSKYNDEQKKSIISNGNNILCIAGAGSGKTTVLTKRIEFLIKYRSIDPSKILAITFTRKARKEMMKHLGESDVMIETFNSFCEKILRRNNNTAYNRQVTVISYGDKIRMVNKALSSLGSSIEKATNIYFSFAQKRGKTDEQLANIFLNDCFFVRDYLKFKNKKLDAGSFDIIDEKHEKSARMVLGVCNYIEACMKRDGLRDFADQLIDTLDLFEKRKDLIPEFTHLLVDEYQDVNSTQIRLLDLLAPVNLFCVGDPRQSIYGWRGSDIKYILNFEEKYPDAEIITLTKNYRSTKHIVDLINKSIRNMRLADLESSIEGDKDIRLLKFDSESAESEFIIQAVLNSRLPRNEIFVLARTNRQLNELSQKMKLRNIKHVVRSDEMKRSVLAKESDVTLATVHSIKGLEAELVFVIGCNTNNFPCRGSEHPVIEMIKVDEYDKEEEERRLFYVAMSRAKKSLYMTYNGKATMFMTDDLLTQSKEKKIAIEPKKEKFNLSKSNNAVTRLKEWRSSLSRELGLPAYMIMHDRTMIDIGVRMPMSMADLESIYGLGPAKIMKYGDDILKVIGG